MGVENWGWKRSVIFGVQCFQHVKIRVFFKSLHSSCGECTLLSGFRSIKQCRSLYIFPFVLSACCSLFIIIWPHFILILFERRDKKQLNFRYYSELRIWVSVGHIMISLIIEPASGNLFVLISDGMNQVKSKYFTMICRWLIQSRRLLIVKHWL